MLLGRRGLPLIGKKSRKMAGRSTEAGNAKGDSIAPCIIPFISVQVEESGRDHVG